MRTISRSPEGRVLAWILENVDPALPVLDLGCGVGTYLNSLPNADRTGVDTHGPYLEELAEGITRIHGDMRLCTPVCRGVVTFVDSLEHIPKHDGSALVEMVQITAKTVLIFAPVGPHENEPCDGNENQRHLSEWYPEDLEAMGFRVLSDPDFHVSNPEGKRAAMFARWDA